MTIRGLLISALSVLVTLLTGCLGGRATNYHLLTGPADEAVSASSGEKLLELGPLSLPRYLDRSGIVIENAAQQLLISDVEQWAEPLGENLTRVLRAHLEACPAVGRVELYPLRASQSGFERLSLDVLQFERVSTGTAVLRVRVGRGLDTKDRLKPAEILFFSMPCSTSDSDFSGTVSCMSQLVTDLGRKLCDSLG